MNNQNVGNENNNFANGDPAPLNNGVAFDMPQGQPVQNPGQQPVGQVVQPTQNVQMAPEQMMNPSVQPVQPVQDVAVDPFAGNMAANQNPVQQPAQPVDQMVQPAQNVGVVNPTMPTAQMQMGAVNGGPMMADVQPQTMTNQAPVMNQEMMNPQPVSQPQMTENVNINPALNTTNSVSLDPNQVVQQPQMPAQPAEQPTETAEKKKSSLGFIIVLGIVLLIVIIALPYIANLLK